MFEDRNIPRRKPPAPPANDQWPDWLRDLWGPLPEGPRLRAQAIEERHRRTEEALQRHRTDAAP